ncbi:asparagine synthase (glutamine-hydrolyzing) [Thermophagus sp. OGC60D27]|uniref:asparagine synthase (glutamine-hydrolyzing) n=1 Tax=Thermophagus sp. OGC60D27 TaxID=3458415 RepID=UPI004037D01B
MCGIAGFTGKKENGESSKKALDRMLTRIRYRGPDEAGVFISDEACLGSVRLSIIDIASGHQPMCDAQGRFWITFNGEIFNYPELKSVLEKRGCHFLTNSDTEVLLLAYREFGTNCLNMLNGQFAFAVWDIKEKSLFLARDRVGIRPLYYTIKDHELVFASEMKSLFEFPGIERKLDYEALQQVFTFWSTLSPKTVFENVLELSPGHYLKFKNGSVEVKKYWEPVFSGSNKQFSGSIEDAGEELEYLLNDAVKLRLRADVSVGSYLSGGLDSAVIASLIRRNSPEGLLQTFSIGFSDQEYDEGGFQDRMVKQLQTKHHKAFCSATDIADFFPATVWHAEMPLLRTAPVPMFLLSRLVRQNNIKVVMTGEGADEMLGGYNLFKEMMVRRFWAKDPKSKLRPMLLSRLYPYLPQIKNMSPAALKMFFGYRLKDVDSVVYSHLLRWHNTARIKKMMLHNNELPESNLIDQMEAQWSSILEECDSLSKAQYIESKIFMSGYLLSAQGDRMAMANSVEGRYPFLDHRVMEFCATLPENFKLKGLKEKVLLKHRFRNQLPQQVINRPKQAYRAPLASPFLNASPNEYVTHLLSPEVSKLVGVFDDKALLRLEQKLKNGNGSSEIDQMGLVAVLSTHLLWQLFVKDFQSVSEKDVIKTEIRNRVTLNS